MIEKSKHFGTIIPFVIAIIALLALSFFSYKRIKNLIEEAARINHANLVKVSLEKSFAALREKESDMRVYMYSKDSAYLSSYLAADTRILLQLNRLDSLISDDPLQQQNAIALKTAIDGRIEMMKNNLALFQASKVSIADRLKGNALMVDVRSHIDKMETEEDKLISIRSASFGRAAFITPLLTIFLIIGSVTFLIVLYFRISQEQNKSNTLTSNLENRTAELEVANYARSLIEASLDPLVTISADGKILDVNAASIKVTGIPREKLIDTDFSSYFTEPEKAREGYLQVFEKGFVSDYPLTIKHKDGNLTDVLYNASVYKDSKGKILGVFAAARDVTEQKWAKDLRVANIELAFQNDEKEKRAAELSIANIELAFQNDEKENRAAELVITNKELESFNYISSHDLQEPLRKIQVFASRLIADESRNLSTKGIDHIFRMQDAANRMQALIADLLAYSRTTSSERKFEITDLNTVMESVKKDFADTLAEKNAVIEVTEMCDARVIPFQFRQLLDNIIGNALKFAKPDLPPHIIIKSSIIKGSEANSPKLSSEKEYCHITITDNGLGFEPQYKDQIFELFKRLHDKEKIKGTGIGLSIVKKIVDNHNGLITATSELNKGANFDIYIPSS
jgi:PAS domain S-box-containing protein